MNLPKKKGTEEEKVFYLICLLQNLKSKMKLGEFTYIFSLERLDQPNGSLHTAAVIEEHDQTRL